MPRHVGVPSKTLDASGASCQMLSLELRAKPRDISTLEGNMGATTARRGSHGPRAEAMSTMQLSTKKIIWGVHAKRANGCA